MRNLNRAGERLAIGLALVLFAAALLGVLQMFGIVE